MAGLGRDGGDVSACEAVLFTVIAVTNFSWGVYTGRREVRHRRQVERLLRLLARKAGT